MLGIDRPRKSWWAVAFTAVHRAFVKANMSIDSKHAYRFGLLKSEKWQNFRLEAMVKHGDRCCVCGKRSLKNDVHHIYYPSSWGETKVTHVVILCRKHHAAVHLLMRMYPRCQAQRAVKFVRNEVGGFKRLLRFLVRRKLSFEKHSLQQLLVNSISPMRRKMLTVGRHGV